jgi:hypothetical protein
VLFVLRDELLSALHEAGPDEVDEVERVVVLEMLSARSAHYPHGYEVADVRAVHPSGERLMVLAQGRWQDRFVVLLVSNGEVRFQGLGAARP